MKAAARAMHKVQVSICFSSFDLAISHRSEPGDTGARSNCQKQTNFIRTKCTYFWVGESLVYVSLSLAWLGKDRGAPDEVVAVPTGMVEALDLACQAGRAIASLLPGGSRKVRAPQGRMLGNAQWG